jgi:tripartite-type tricarboxylate transporter receptor subunit TctC
MGDAIGMLTGSTDMLIVATVPAIPCINSRLMVPLAVSSATRSTTLPNVPSVLEAGLPRSIVRNWFGLVAPIDAKHIVDWLHSVLVKTLSLPDMKKSARHRAWTRQK